MPVCKLQTSKGDSSLPSTREFQFSSTDGRGPFSFFLALGGSRNRRSPEVGPASPTRGGRCIHYQFSVSNAKPPEAPNTCPWIVDGTVAECRATAGSASLQPLPRYNSLCSPPIPMPWPSMPAVALRKFVRFASCAASVAARGTSPQSYFALTLSTCSVSKVPTAM